MNFLRNHPFLAPLCGVCGGWCGVSVGYLTYCFYCGVGYVRYPLHVTCAGVRTHAGACVRVRVRVHFENYPEKCVN